MLDVFDFIVEKGGDPQKIKESQRKRYAPEEAVDEVIALYEDHRKSMLQSSSQLRGKDANKLFPPQLNTQQHKSIRRSTTYKNKLARRRRRRRMQTT